MKHTPRFLRVRRYLNTYFDYIWTVCIGPDGKRVGPMKRRFILRTSDLAHSARMQLDQMKLPLSVYDRAILGGPLTATQARYCTDRLLGTGVIE